ncbi:MAG TPA: type II secretion system protein GspG [Candidatus Aquilonibacter sp.]|nr:type II secretion system protein GspG [Candidatus Aquilonibacter sp.]
MKKISPVVFGLLAAILFAGWSATKADTNSIASAVPPPVTVSTNAPDFTTQALQDEMTIKTALDQFEMDNGFYPRSLQDFFKQPAGATHWSGPYLDPPRLPVDPWGHEYVYECPGTHNTNSYDLFSAGPDGKPGTDDDIGNWTK